MTNRLCKGVRIPVRTFSFFLRTCTVPHRVPHFAIYFNRMIHCTCHV